MKNDNTSLSSNVSITTDTESKSKTSSFSSINITNLTNTLVKSCDWLNDLLELHYFAYNSCSSLTIYSYKYLPSQKKILLSTKENNIKEIFFEVRQQEDIAERQTPSIAGNIETALISTRSTRSSLSSSNSNANTRHTSATNDETCNNESSLNAENKCPSVMGDSAELSYLEPVYKIQKLNKTQGDALISSIDVIEINNFLVLSVTFALKRKPEQYLLHIYCDFETSDIDLITDCEHEFELSAMPHRVSNLKHLKITEETEPGLQTKRIAQTSSHFVFVNCSQKLNLLYLVDVENRKFSLVKKMDEYFSELNYDVLNENICSHDMKYACSGFQSANKKSSWVFDRRLTAIGSQTGWLGVYLVDVTKNEILKSWEYENDSFLTQLQIFTTKSIIDWSKLDVDRVPVNLLVLRSLEPTRIFNNIFHSEDGFESYQDLEISGNYDIVTSAVIYDATFCGFNSIVLGTFGRSVLFFCPIKTYSDSSETNPPGEIGADVSESSNRRPRHGFSYELKKEIGFKHSVLGLLTGLLSNNGALDLIILTLNGISVWQYDPDKVIDLANRLFELKEQVESSKELQPAAAVCSNSTINNDLTTSF